ncbi:MAG TPA: SDR family oxidoreductase [Chitinophagales bacterium]|nr:SDR family oxidoreductase [Chitinophagales bacterium]
MSTLQNKVVWVTGASSGIGEALVYALAKEGAKLVLSARRKEELERVATACQLPPDNILVLPLDLADESDFTAAKDAVVNKFGRIDILVNNGGISQRSLAKDTAVDVDRRIMEINYFGTIALTKIVLPQFIKQKAGLYVVVSSAVGKFGSPWRSGYSASKHALHGFFDSLRAELYADGITVLIVCPGFIQTNVSVNALTGNGDKLGSMDAATAKGLTASECARQIISAIKSGKEEIVVAKFKERFGVLAKRFAPGVFSAMIRRMKVR